MIARLIGWPVDRPVGRLVDGRVFDWAVAWLGGWSSVACLVDLRLIGWWICALVGCLVGLLNCSILAWLVFGWVFD